MTLVPEHFPFVFRQRRMPLAASGPATIRVIPKVGKSKPAGTVSITSATTGNETGPLEAGTELVKDGNPTDLTLQSTLQASVADDVEDVVVIIDYTVGKPKA